MRISDWSSDVCSSDLAAIPELGFDADLVAVRIFGQHLVQSWTRGRSAIEGAGFVPLRVGSVHQNIPEGLGLEADLRRPLRVAPMLIAGELERAGRGPEGLGVAPAFLDRLADSPGGAQPAGGPDRALPNSRIGLDRQGRGLKEATGGRGARGHGAGANPPITQTT